ncbi:circadian clock-controlled protein daywake-like [Anoplolepis gracilipes]|uniref:circadian clock-controlled protein daywake-like n=1 Tax=Anoplolepis gracilipes TaxID=354296 RepID=UPI003BA2FA92
MTAKATITAILLVLATIDAEAVRDIPEFLHVCQVREPDYETCVSNSIIELKPYLKVGVPEYNIPSLEPLKLKKLMITTTSSLQIVATDVNVCGASNFEVIQIKIDIENLLFMVDVALPHITVDGKYDVDGKILLLPIRGSGPMNGNFSDCIGKCKIQGERYFDENSVEKVRITEFTLNVSVGKGSLRLENLFNGDQVLGDLINSAINNNFELFLKEFLPSVEMALSDAFRGIADNIVQQFSFEQLFPGI